MSDAQGDLNKTNGQVFGEKNVTKLASNNFISAGLLHKPFNMAYYNKLECLCYVSNECARLIFVFLLTPEKRPQDTQHNNIQRNDTQDNDIQHKINNM